jgi:hypothetical protein
MSYYNDYADDLLESMLGDLHPYNKNYGNKLIHMKLTIDEKKGVAIIELPLQAPRTSATGKTVNIAEARNQHTDVVFQGKNMKVTAQVYYKP